MSLPESVKPLVYLLDVEGTTSPLSLVNDQLFPYARTHLESFLRKQFLGPATHDDLALLNAENQAETSPGAPRTTDPADVDQALAYTVWLMDQNRKSTALKSIQGRIWKTGFDDGELIGTVFPDVPEALSRWSKRARIAIYSSGSVEAQRLLFAHSNAGDLTNYISAYYDTRVGPKTAAGSYGAIAASMNLDPRELLFVSDVVAELDAARQAGCQTRLSVRAGDVLVYDPHGHTAIGSFAEID